MLTTAEFAAMFRVNVRRVGIWLKAGKVPGAVQTPGGRWRIPGSSARELLMRGYVPADPDVVAELGQRMASR